MMIYLECTWFLKEIFGGRGYDFLKKNSKKATNKHIINFTRMEQSSIKMDFFKIVYDIVYFACHFTFDSN